PGRGPDEPAAPDWRLILAGLPADGEEEPAGRGARRRWRRARRQEQRRQRAGTAAELRGRPMSPLVVLLVVAVLLVLGVLSRCGGTPPPADARPPAPAPAPARSAPPAPAPPAPVSADASPEDVAGAWVRALLTRDPLADGSHRPSVSRAARWATPELTASLERAPAPGWGRQVSRGEVTRVVAVAVVPAGEDLPPDSPAQVWRRVTATVQADGYASVRRDDVVQVEVMLTTAGWRVARVLGV
ncbi:hypothetical protein AB0D01_39740, partial [Streptomyces sp. NPDC048606]